MKERGEYHSIYTSLPDDEDFLITTPTTKAVWYTLKMTLPSIGIGSMNPRVLATRVNCTLPELDAAMLELTPKWVRRVGNVFWIVNGLRYHPALSPDDPKHRKFVVRKLAELADSPLVSEFRALYPEWVGGARSPSEGPSKGLGAPLRGASEIPRGTTNNKQQTTDENEHRTTAATYDSRATDAIAWGPADGSPEAAVVLTSAANLGITDRYGEQPSPLRHGSAASLRAAEEIAEAGVPLLLARDAIFSVCGRIKLDRPPKSLRYFVPAVTEQWSVERERMAGALLPKPTSRERDVRRLMRSAHGGGRHDELLDKWLEEQEATMASNGQ